MWGEVGAYLGGIGGGVNIIKYENIKYLVKYYYLHETGQLYKKKSGLKNNRKTKISPYTEQAPKSKLL